MPVGLAAVALLQMMAAAAVYPVLAVAVILATDLIRVIVRNETGVWGALVFAGPLMAIGSLFLTAVFAAVPFVVCVVGGLIVGRLGRRRGATVTTSQLLKFGSALVIGNVALLLAGAWIWPVWWYTQKLATIRALWPLALLFAGNAAFDAAVTATTIRAQLGAVAPRR